MKDDEEGVVIGAGGENVEKVEVVGAITGGGVSTGLVTEVVVGFWGAVEAGGGGVKVELGRGVVDVDLLVGGLD